MCSNGSTEGSDSFSFIQGPESVGDHASSSLSMIWEFLMNDIGQDDEMSDQKLINCDITVYNSSGDMKE